MINCRREGPDRWWGSARLSEDSKWRATHRVFKHAVESSPICQQSSDAGALLARERICFDMAAFCPIFDRA